MPDPPNNSPRQLINQAFDKAVASIAPDIPYLMHGAGDVVPSEVLPSTAQLVAALTVQYMAKLVDAAIDAHEMLQGSSVVSLPPPSVQRSRQPPIPPPPRPKPLLAETDAVTLPKKRRRARDDYWDEPLPEPKIRNKTNKDSTTAHRNDSSSSAATKPHIDEWVGLAGVDFQERRARAAYVQGPAALSTQSFLFPICHDVYTYGRVRQVQASRLSLAPLLQDPVLTELVRAEGKSKHAPATAGRATDPEEENDDANDEDASDNEEERPVWPGLEDILPVYRG